MIVALAFFRSGLRSERCGSRGRYGVTRTGQRSQQALINSNNTQVSAGRAEEEIVQDQQVVPIQVLDGRL
jgi:hypothetical protein